jgi:hypothetical protein
MLKLDIEEIREGFEWAGSRTRPPSPKPPFSAFFTRRRGSGMTRKGWYIEELAGLAIAD